MVNFTVKSNNLFFNRYYILLLLVGFLMNLEAQEVSYLDSDYFTLRTSVIHGDTLPIYAFSEVNIYAPRVFKSEREKREYGRLKYYVAKVYPYAKIAGEMLQDFDDTLRTITSERKRKVYIKAVEKQLMAEFEGELKKLTIKQGIILIKLIDRETGNTSYDLVKELRGSFSAFLWQSLARLFGSNLKLQYDPNGEDALIEEIVVLIERGQIPYVKRERRLKSSI